MNRDKSSHLNRLIEQVQEQEHPAEAEDASMAAAKISDMESTASSERRSTRAAKQPETLT